MHRIPVHPADEGWRYTRTNLRRPEALARALTEPVLAHLREALLSGIYIAVENSVSGDTFVGTEAEAVEFMMAHGGH